MSLPFVQLCSILMLCATTIFAPHLHDLNSLLYVFFASGLASGLFCGSAISRILTLYGNESAPMLQLLDCTYGFGSILGPFISRFFLIDITIHMLNHGSSAHGAVMHSHGENVTNLILLFVHPHTNETLSKEDLKIIYPYSILTVYSAICAIALIVLYIVKKEDEIHKSRLHSEESKCESTTNSMATLPSTDSDKEIIQNEKAPNKSWAYTFKTSTIILIAALCYALANGTGMVEQSFITKYVTISHFNLTAAQGATIESSSWVTNVIFGAGCIVIINKFGLEITLTVCAVITAFSQVFMLSLFGTGMEWVLWITVNLVSMGTTPLFGTLIAYLETKFPVSSRAAAFYLILNCMGNVTWPIVVSTFIDAWPDVYVYAMAMTALSSSTLAIVVLILAKVFFPSPKSASEIEKEEEEQPA